MASVSDSAARTGFGPKLRSRKDGAAIPLDDLDNTNQGRRYTVRERVDDTIRELRWQCDDAARVLGRPVEPEIIVLAGGGCRLPLIAERMRQECPRATGTTASAST